MNGVELEVDRGSLDISLEREGGLTLTPNPLPPPFLLPPLHLRQGTCPIILDLVVPQVQLRQLAGAGVPVGRGGGERSEGRGVRGSWAVLQGQVERGEGGRSSSMSLLVMAVLQWSEGASPHT